MPRSRVVIFRNERTRSTPFDHKLKILVCFILFGCIRDCLFPLRNSVQNGPNQCKSSCHEVASEFFAPNSSDPPHCTVNRCFDAFRTIWVHSALFGCLTKLGHNECTQSTPLDPILTFWCVSYYLVAFVTVGPN